MVQAHCTAGLSQWEDEVLVLAARVDGCLSARDELILRYLGPTRELVARRLSRWWLPQSDVDDAQQEAVFWVMEAIGRYNSEFGDQPDGCRFRSFLRRVVIARLTDFLRSVGRSKAQEGRLYAHAIQTNGSRFRVTAGGRDHFVSPANADDPATCAARRESIAQLHGALTQLDDPMRQLGGLLAQGVRLRAIAEELGISYDAVKRRRRKLLAHLRIDLKG